MQTLEKTQPTRASATAKSVSVKSIAPKNVVSELEKHILVDGFKIVIDLEKSRGSNLVDAPSGRSFIDLYSFYASQPIGYNHPHFDKPEVEADLLAAAKIKVANADMYSTQYAGFVVTFARVMGLPPMERYFFIEAKPPSLSYDFLDFHQFRRTGKNRKWNCACHVFVGSLFGAGNYLRPF